jgi:hypothetical protein
VTHRAIHWGLIVGFALAIGACSGEQSPPRAIPDEPAAAETDEGGIEDYDAADEEEGLDALPEDLDEPMPERGDFDLGEESEGAEAGDETGGELDMGAETVDPEIED